MGKVMLVFRTAVLPLAYDRGSLQDAGRKEPRA